MASFLSFLSFYFILFSTFLITINGAFSEQFPEINAAAGRGRVKKMSHLHFYFHDIVSGKRPTAIRIITPSNQSFGGFGSTAMIDDPLTEGPDPKSKLVGRAQGLYSMASQQDNALLMVLNLVFVEGKYNGSALSILGRNLVTETVREMPIVGGSGLFRFASGYALANTIKYNAKTGDAVVEYNVFVQHY